MHDFFSVVVPVVAIVFGMSLAIVRILRQANAGPAAARNHGLDAMSPDSHYIAFLDSDDQWSTHHLACGIDTLGTANDFYFCDSAMPPTTMFAAMAFFRTLPTQHGVEPLDGTSLLTASRVRTLVSPARTRSISG